MVARHLKPGDRVYRYVRDEDEGQVLQVLTLVRVTPKLYIVKTSSGDFLRVPRSEIVPARREEEEEEK